MKNESKYWFYVPHEAYLISLEFKPEVIASNNKVNYSISGLLFGTQYLFVLVPENVHSGTEPYVAYLRNRYQQ